MFIHTRILRVNDLYSFVLEMISKPDKQLNSVGYNHWEKGDEAAEMQLMINMNLTLYHQLNRGMSDSIELWVNILKRFEHLSITTATNVNEWLRSKKIQNEESMKTHIDGLRKLQDEYLNCEENLFDDDEMQWRAPMNIYKQLRLVACLVGCLVGCILTSIRIFFSFKQRSSAAAVFSGILPLKFKFNSVLHAIFSLVFFIFFLLFSLVWMLLFEKWNRLFVLVWWCGACCHGPCLWASLWQFFGNLQSSRRFHFIFFLTTIIYKKGL